MWTLHILAAALLASVGHGLCPFAHGPPGDRSAVPDHVPLPLHDGHHARAAATLDWSALKKDVVDLLHSPQAAWPADYGNYGPLFVRLAWHCSGSYRTSDGRGGCDGGRQRFEPERSWEDNTNLDKARALLLPLKRKYGAALSWGDLFIFTGTVAVADMGGPILGFCAGRIDADNGAQSVQLGPSKVQEELFPCKNNGDCIAPLGSSTVGLIYVNPTGPDGRPIPRESAPRVRDTFARMNMNDTETVALIGGGHAFGKTHGACPAGAGSPPSQDPINPWPGNCGTGRGRDAYTSGLEGPWTTNPTQWDNEYFRNLLGYKWTLFTGPGGKPQWAVDPSGPRGPGMPRAPASFGNGTEPIRMMTTDISLINDPVYLKIVRQYASDSAAFDRAFAHAWYKLTTRDMGPHSRCVGPMTPPPQPWQNPLPKRTPVLPDFAHVRSDIVAAMRKPLAGISTDYYDGIANYGPLFVRLAWQCASTFRATDFLGGCNGARIRFDPENTWPENKGLDEALAILAPIKTKYGDTLSWGDLIVLSGNVAVEQAGGKPMDFCPGRSDAVNGDGSTFLQSRLVGDDISTTLLKDVIQVMGLTQREFVALLGGGHSLGKKHADRSGYTGAWTSSPTVLSNEYFRLLVGEQWQRQRIESAGGARFQYVAKRANVTMLEADVLLVADGELAEHTLDFASDNEVFLTDFSAAWTKMMNADRFDGPDGSVCIK